jgi:hypothetical protein
MSINCKTKHFSRWAAKVGLSNAVLKAAIREMQAGLIDADLGGGLVKKRVAFPGRGKRGSARTILATNRTERWIYIYGFEKKERDNITPKELEALRLLAADLLRLSDEQVLAAIRQGVLVEVDDEKNKA